MAHKTLDEVLTMWSTSLTSHQKSFKDLATQVSAWDRQMVENSMKISALYSRCFQAERDCSEVERQLTNVEHTQNDIAAFLDRYEAEVDQMMQVAGVDADGISGVDAERDNTYKLAEQCSARLGDVSRSLNDMVAEINNASSKLSSTTSTGEDRKSGANESDPLKQIVRTLNSHLIQLQNIGEGAQSLQGQIASAQRDARSLGGAQGINGGGSWVDDFGRSYLGRR
jgi:nuclear pore complex protein Nup62